MCLWHVDNYTSTYTARYPRIELSPRNVWLSEKREFTNFERFQRSEENGRGTTHLLPKKIKVVPERDGKTNLSARDQATSFVYPAAQE